MGKKIVMVILDQFADWEGAFLAAALTGGELSQNNQVIWASLDKEPKQSIGHMTLLPDLSLEEIPGDADAIVLIGGMSWRTPEADRVQPVVRSFLDNGKIAGFICDAARFAAWSGFLNEVRHTGNDPAEMKEGAGYTNPQNFQKEEAVWDGQIVTANGNSPLPFARLMLKAMEAAGDEEIDTWIDFYSIGYWNALRKYGYIQD